MANDGSLASQMEDWIVEQIQAIQHGGGDLFNAEDVRPWEGTEQNAAEAFANEVMSGHRDLVAVTYFLEDSIEQLEEGEIKPVPRFVVLVAIRNAREGASRRGDGTSVGTNLLRDKLRYALHDQLPMSGGTAINDGVSSYGRVRWMGTKVIWHQKIGVIIRGWLLIDEEPYAGA